MPVRVEIDDRDIRGGEKKWHHVKRGVPIRLEIGPKDIEKNSVFLGRRDQPKSVGMDRDELVATIGRMLGRDAARTCSIARQSFAQTIPWRSTTKRDFRDFFTPKNADQPEIHGGFAHCHFADESIDRATTQGTEGHHPLHPA